MKAKLWMPFGGETGLMDSLEDRDCKAGGTVGWEAWSCGWGGRTSVGNNAGHQNIGGPTRKERGEWERTKM